MCTIEVSIRWTRGAIGVSIQGSFFAPKTI